MEKISRLPATGRSAKTIRRILVFDNHPDSLRLILRRPANRPADRRPEERASLWKFIAPVVAILVALTAMLLPLF
jgi:hypothetical protein